MTERQKQLDPQGKMKRRHTQGNQTEGAGQGGQGGRGRHRPTNGKSRVNSDNAGAEEEKRKSRGEQRRWEEERRGEEQWRRAEGVVGGEKRRRVKESRGVEGEEERKSGQKQSAGKVPNP